MIEALIMVAALTFMLLLNKAIRQSSKPGQKEDLGFFAYKATKHEATKAKAKGNTRA